MPVCKSCGKIRPSDEHYTTRTGDFRCNSCLLIDSLGPPSAATAFPKWYGHRTTGISSNPSLFDKQLAVIESLYVFDSVPCRALRPG